MALLPALLKRPKSSTQAGAISKKKPLILRWLIAHEPISTFAVAAQYFSDIVSKDTDGRVEVRVLSSADLGRGKRLTPLEAAKKVASGELEMCQTYTSTFAQFHDKLLALELPFLFRDHAHAARVMDGPIGARLMAGLLPHNIRGLEFTYSGGYRILEIARGAIRELKDFEGLRIRTSPNPVATAVFEALGAKPVPALLEDVRTLSQQGKIDGGEITYPRYWHREHFDFHRTVVETHHSLLLTMMVVNEPYFQRLPAACRTVIEGAAERCALMERKDSIEIGNKVRTMCREKGIGIIPFSKVAREKMERRTKPVYERFAAQLGKKLIEDIRNS